VSLQHMISSLRSVAGEYDENAGPHVIDALPQRSMSATIGGMFGPVQYSHEGRRIVSPCCIGKGRGAKDRPDARSLCTRPIIGAASPESAAGDGVACLTAGMALQA